MECIGLVWCIVPLDGDCLLVNPGDVDNKFVNRFNIRLTLSLSSPQLIFLPRVLFFSAILLVILGQYTLKSK